MAFARVRDKLVIMVKLLTPAEVVAFWIEAGPDKWFAKDAVFDVAFTERCRDTHFAAAARKLDDWTATPEGSLALIILLDQLPRNAFRDTAHMFATDSLALMFGIAHGSGDPADPAGRDRAAEHPQVRRDSPRHHRPLRPLPAPQPLPRPRNHGG